MGSFTGISLALNGYDFEVENDNVLEEIDFPYEFACWHQFEGTDVEIRVEDDGEVAWAYLVQPPHEIFGLAWLYNVCPRREEISQSESGALIVPGVEPVPEEGRIRSVDDLKYFGAFTEDGLGVELMIISVRGKMRALVVAGQKMAYTVEPVGIDALVQLPAVVWAKVPQELKLCAMEGGCELVSFDV